MTTRDFDIRKLEDLDKLRTAPKLDVIQSKLLLNQVELIIHKADWLTIGVMSPSLEIGLNAVRRIEDQFKFNKARCITLPTSDGPIFLKANQKSGEIHARVEHGLGEGILISCHCLDQSLTSKTIGPLPLDFFN